MAERCGGAKGCEDAPGATVLFVDDDPNQREMYKRRLERRGYRVQLASDVDAAVSTLKSSRPDVVVLDLAMPERDGLSGLQEFLQIDPSLPIVINTAYPAYAENFVAWAADGWVEKTSDLAPLLTAIERVLGRPAQTH
jgi:DNA-binding NtrC family response regulator